MCYSDKHLSYIDRLHDLVTIATSRAFPAELGKTP